MNRLIIILWVLVALPSESRSHDLGVSKVTIRVAESNIFISAMVPPADAAAFKAPQIGGYELRGFDITRSGKLTAHYDTDSAQNVEFIMFPWQRQGLMVTIQLPGVHSYTQYVPAEEGVIYVPLSPGLQSQSFWNKLSHYTSMGIEHILMGLDHLLFIIGLLFLVRGTKALIKTITAFTIAHSITLALAAFNIIDLQPGLVDTLVALSILFIGVEILKNRDSESTLTVRRPWLVAFTFGLIHGIGFAGALNELGLPIGELPLVLLLFNIGVELGQLIFIAVLLIAVRSYLLLGFPKLTKPTIPAYTIGISASVWFFVRIFELFEL